MERSLLNDYDYEKVMILKIFVDDESNDNELKKKYIEAASVHNKKIENNLTMIDAGFDLYTPSELENKTLDIHFRTLQIKNLKLDFKIKCSAKMYTETKVYNTGYYMYPRSSISKTPLRLANSTGIIDAGYRGNLMSMFDLLEEYYQIKKFDRYIQICAPSLVPILVEIVDNIEDLGEETERGVGGFGSTGR